MNRKHTSRTRPFGAAAVLAALVAILSPMPSQDASAAPAKITICHRTHATTNPYRRITVSQNAVQNARHGGHDLPNGSSNPAVYDSSFGYASNNKYWGDVIPGSTNGGSTYGGTSSVALNWTTAGQSLFFGATCAAMTPKAFYDAEIAAGQTASDVLADLNDQLANEDTALLAALGGSFTAGNLTTWETAVTVTTDAATNVATATATLNGALTVGSTSTATSFQYGTDLTLASFSTVAATPSPVTGTASVSAAVSGLSPATTYAFRLLGTTNAGTDTEGILYGEILTFTTPAAGTTTTSTTTTSTTSTTSTTTAPPTTTTAAPTTTTAAPTTTTTAPPTTTTAAPTTTAPPTTAAPTTTTAPPTTTTAPTAEPRATVNGTVWFDRDDDGRMGPQEWPLPGVTVVLSSTEPVLGLQNGPTMPATLAAHTTVTAADGTYAFTDLAPGAYQVVATVDLRGFSYTTDTDGVADWVVGVVARPDQPAVADFAGLGQGEVTGQVIDQGSQVGVPHATVRCTWSGFDDRAGTADDVTFTVTAGDDGTFDLAGVPYGDYSCAGQDAVSGRTSAPTLAVVLSAEAVRTSLPVAADLAERPVALAFTGASTTRLLLVAMLLLLIGFALEVRRRPHDRRAGRA